MIPKSGHEHQLHSENTGKVLGGSESGHACLRGHGLWTLSEGSDRWTWSVLAPVVPGVLSERVARVERRSQEPTKRHPDHQARRR